MVAWKISSEPVPYEEAVSFMEHHVDGIINHQAPEMIWLLEHPALYPRGVSARNEDLLSPHFLPIHETGRGGRFTYHGPGQRVVYVMLDLRKRHQDVRDFVCQLEYWIIDTLKHWKVDGFIRKDR